MDFSRLKRLPVVVIANQIDRALGGMNWGAVEKGTRLRAASTLLHTVALALMASPTASAVAPLSISTHNLDVEIRSHRGNAMADDRLVLNVTGNEMELYWSAITTDNHTGPTRVGFINYHNLGSALEGAWAGEGAREGAGPEPADFRLISSVVTVAVGQGFGSSLREPLNLTLMHSEEVGSGIVQCFSLPLGEEGMDWSRRGCEVVTAGRDRTTCRCQYLASFAILASPAPVQDHVALHIITVVGVSVSLVGLAVAVATFALCRSVPRETRAMHANLCLSLFLAQLLFVTGINSTSYQ
ncbi:adhesion G protein-coupled receptor E3-like, partial [Amblyraja radiata]|uniref:adhesion G protein-coupled receptor E3-like n=1 Tax=Amblyraja radiata TaxID=386614 RepID=UPI00140419EA